jgi:hypothetical protein
MSNSTTKKFSPVTLPPQTSKSSSQKSPVNDVQLQVSRFQTEEYSAGWQPRPNESKII